MNKEELSKSLEELRSIENMLSTLTPYSDDWFVWNELRLEEERKIRCYINFQKRFIPTKNKTR